MYSGSVDDVEPRLSKIILTHAALGAGLNLADSIRTRGVQRSVVLLALGAGLPAVGELIATGSLGLLRHHTQPRIAGVPVAIVLGWYGAVHGSFTFAERVLSQLPLDEAARSKALPTLAALLGTSLDLALDPAGLEAGLWEWKADGTYAREVEGPNERTGVPLVNYLDWFALVGGAVSVYGRVCQREGDPEGGRLPGLLLLPPYLTALLWAVGDGGGLGTCSTRPFPGSAVRGPEKGITLPLRRSLERSKREHEAGDPRRRPWPRRRRGLDDGLRLARSGPAGRDHSRR